MRDPGQPSEQPVHALVLAAGASRRMGRPKALLPHDGGTFVGRLVRIFGEACDTVTVVTGAHTHLIQGHLPRYVNHVHASDWQRGMRASLRAGLWATRPGHILLTHVDRPCVGEATVGVLVESAGRQPVVPTYRGRPGHPVLLPDWLRDRLEVGDDTPLRVILEGMQVKRLSVEDPGVLENINRPEDYARLHARGP